MAIFVIAIHTHPFESFNLGFFGKIYGIFVGTAVPFFFMASGFLLFEKIDSVINIERLWNYLIRIIKLYFIWTLIYMPLTVYDYVNDKSILKAIFSFTKGYLFRGEHYNSWILWYLLSLIYSIFLIGILLKSNVSLKRIYIISIILFVFGNIMTFLCNNLDNLQGGFKTAVKLYKYAFGGDGRLFIGMFYISTGILIARNKINISIGLCLCAMFIGILCNLFTPPLLSSLGIAICSVMIFIIALKIQLRNHTMYQRFRDTSTIFYFVHLICWSFYTIVYLGKPDQYGMDSFIVTLAGCLVLSIIILFLKQYKKFRWIKMIF